MLCLIQNKKFIKIKKKNIKNYEYKYKEQKIKIKIKIKSFYFLGVVKLAFGWFGHPF
jgi:hypothetical protein